MANGNNGTTAKWMAIIISLTIAFAGLAFGIIRTSNADKIKDLQRHIDKHEEMITKMREGNARTEIQIENVQSQLQQLNKKMDIILEKLGK